MRCPQCHSEVGQATRCPHCHTVVLSNDANQRRSGPRGHFRGRMDQTATDHSKAGGRSWLGAIGRFLLDPRAPFRSKLLLVLAVLYVLLPLDVLPGGLIPVIGWIDDIIVSLLAWTFIGPEVRRSQTR